MTVRDAHATGFPGEVRYVVGKNQQRRIGKNLVTDRKITFYMLDKEGEPQSVFWLWGRSLCKSLWKEE